MSLCDTLVVSNSTLSWWGAWLGDADRTIVRPSVWPLSDGVYQPEDIFPADWLVAAGERDTQLTRTSNRAVDPFAAAFRRGASWGRRVLNRARP